MRIAIYTSNQPRHLALIERLAAQADEVYAVMECNTVFPGCIEDFFRKSPVMQEYFGHVQAAERKVFGQVRPLPANVHTMPIRMGDLNHLSMPQCEPMLACDRHVVFGASYIKGPLCAALVEREAINIHMGVSPFYRGSSTNFWALYDGRADLVGATVHRLTSGLDSGPILFHALPPAHDWEAFELGMRAVEAAHEGLAEALETGMIDHMRPIPQERTLELRYTRNADFTDEIAGSYLQARPRREEIARCLQNRNLTQFQQVYVPEPIGAGCAR